MNVHVIFHSLPKSYLYHATFAKRKKGHLHGRGSYIHKTDKELKIKWPFLCALKNHGISCYR